MLPHKNCETLPGGSISRTLLIFIISGVRTCLKNINNFKKSKQADHAHYVSIKGKFVKESFAIKVFKNKLNMKLFDIFIQKT